MLVDLEAVGVRSYISEPDRGRRNWTKNPDARDAVYRNRRRILRERGKRLLRRRGELLERPFAHLYETRAMRRVYLRGHQNILKRILLHAAAMNLGLLMRTLFGVGTPRGLQGRVAAVFIILLSFVTLWARLRSWYRPIMSTLALQRLRKVLQTRFTLVSSFATGC
jgi:transposase